MRVGFMGLARLFRDAEGFRRRPLCPLPHALPVARSHGAAAAVNGIAAVRGAPAPVRSLQEYHAVALEV